MLHLRSAMALCLLLAGMGARGDVADYLGPRTLAAVRSHGKLTNSATGGADLLYLPRVACAEAVRREVDEVEPTVVVELLAAASYPGRSLSTPEGKLAIHNCLRSLSRLEGLEYYSSTHGGMRVLYKRSYRIASPKSQERLPDPLVSSPPAHEELWVYQEDTTFGGNVYSVSYDDATAYVLMEVSNRSTMRYMLLPIVPEGRMRLSFLVIPDGEEVLFYAVAAVKLTAAWARGGAVERSFGYRVDAMYRWFGHMLESL